MDGWLVGCLFRFNGPLRQYYTVYIGPSPREGDEERKHSQEKKMFKQPPPAPTASAIGPCHVNQIKTTPRECILFRCTLGICIHSNRRTSLYILCNSPFSHCLCVCVYRSRDALFHDNRRDFTQIRQTDFKPLILSM